MAELRIMPVTGIGEVRPGDDLAAIIVNAAPWLSDGDVLVVTSKIVSKAEGRLITVPVAEAAATREAVIDSETVRVVAQRGMTRIVQTRHGLVLAAAGVDASNVDPGRLVLLPLDPDASARRLRAALRVRYARMVAVVITDTMGRPWRVGQVDFAIGVAGLDPLLDHRGLVDGYGNELHVSITAVADQLACAAELVKGKRDGIPAAVVRGWRLVSADDGPGASALIRAADLDLFSLGTAEAVAQGRAAGHAEGLLAAADLHDADAFGDAPVDPHAVDRALKAFAPCRGSLVTWHRAEVTADAGSAPHSRLPVGCGAAVVIGAGPDMTAAEAETETSVLEATPSAGRAEAAPEIDLVEAALTAGEVAQRLRAALAAQGLATVWIPCNDGSCEIPRDLVAPTTPVGFVAFGVLAIGTAAAHT